MTRDNLIVPILEDDMEAASTAPAGVTSGESEAWATDFPKFFIDNNNVHYVPIYHNTLILIILLFVQFKLDFC